jgi:hypothetical protein
VDVVESSDSRQRLADRSLVGRIVDPAVCGGEHGDGASSGLVREALLELVERVL